MALLAAGIWPLRVRRRRAANKVHSACVSTEELYLSTRLTEVEVQELVTEFCQWSMHGVKTGWWYAERRVKLFVLYLANTHFDSFCKVCNNSRRWAQPILNPKSRLRPKLIPEIKL